jgi:hypothetical protein
MFALTVILVYFDYVYRISLPKYLVLHIRFNYLLRYHHLFIYLFIYLFLCLSIHQYIYL